MNFPILTMLVLLPVAGSLLTAIISNRQPDLVKVTALLTSAATGGMSIWLLFAFKKGDAGFQFVSEHAWIRAWGISWHLGVDGISLFLVVLTGLLFPLVIAGIDPHHDHKRYLSWMLLLQAGVMGSFVSLDLFLFFVFFEIVLVPMYFLIGNWGYDQRVYAATKFFIYTMAGSAFMLVGLVATAFLARRDIGHLSFDLIEIAEKSDFAIGTGRWLFVGFVIAFAVKVPLFPLHTWLPDVHVEAPTGGSVVLAAIMLKLGGYGFLRLSLPIVPDASQYLSGFMIFLSLVAVVYIGLVALVQTDMKKLIAYSSISHMGFVTLGIFIFSEQGMQGAILQMVNHGLITGALFLSVGIIYERTHDRTIAKMGGLAGRVPVWAVAFGFFTMASVGLPGLAGFVGEFLVFLGTFAVSPIAAGIAALVMVFGAVYLLCFVGLGYVAHLSERSE